MNETIECRYCGKTKAAKFLDLGKQALANSFLENKSEAQNEEKFILDVYYCDDCGLVQISEVIDPEILFRDYIYFSSTSETIHKHGKYLAEEFKNRFNLGRDSLVVEIASNDGTVLKYFQNHDMQVLGVEPAVNIAKVAIENGIETVNKFFNYETAEEIKKTYDVADLILARNVFAHIPEIHNFVKGLKLLLEKNGVIAIEAPHLMELMNNNQFDTIYHEHVTYLSLRAMQNLFESFGMKIFDVEFSSLNGGSLIYFISHQSSNHENTTRLEKYQTLERDHGLYDWQTFENFGSKVEKVKTELLDLIDRIKMEGKSLAGYGASAKGMVLLQYFNLDNDDLEFIADISEHKQDKLTPGTHIPVKPPTALYEDMPDYTLLLAWNLAEEIISQQTEYLKAGGKFIIPIPIPKVVGIEDVE